MEEYLLNSFNVEMTKNNQNAHNMQFEESPFSSATYSPSLNSRRMVGSRRRRHALARAITAMLLCAHIIKCTVEPGVAFQPTDRATDLRFHALAWTITRVPIRTHLIKNTVVALLTFQSDNGSTDLGFLFLASSWTRRIWVKARCILYANRTRNTAR